MDTIITYQDWLYIGAVVLAFFVFLIWSSKSRNKSRSNKRNTFKQRYLDRKKNQQSQN